MPEEDSAHAFDFWIGEWVVSGPQGRVLGASTITGVLGTGALSEHWRGAGGFEGRSLSTYDPFRGCWHQTWVDSSGGVLMLDGGVVDGSMVLEAQAPAEEGGAPQHQRITWTPGPDGVRQHWESSEDATTWVTAFDGYYRRAD